jgi:hypothetical protein
MTDHVIGSIPAMLWAMLYVGACLINLYADFIVKNRPGALLIRLATIFVLSFLSMTFHLTL